METPKEPPDDIVPVIDYNPSRWLPAAPEKKKANPLVKLLSLVIVAAFFGALFYYMGYQIARDELQHTAYEIANTIADQAAPDDTSDRYQAVAAQQTAEKQKERGFILKSVETEVIPAGATNIKIVTVSLEGRFLFTTINVSWWVRL